MNLFSEDHYNSPLLNGDGSFYDRYGINPHPSIITQLVGDYFEHLAAFHLDGTIINHTSGELPDLLSERHKALVEVKGCVTSTSLKVQVKQIEELQECRYEGWNRKWFVIFVHEATGIAGGLLSATEVLEKLAQKQRFGLVLDVSIMKAFLNSEKLAVSGPYEGKDGGWVLPPIAHFRPKRDLQPIAERTESKLTELGLNFEDYDIHREIANRYTNPFILTWVVPKGCMKKVLKERPVEEVCEVPF